MECTICIHTRQDQIPLKRLQELFGPTCQISIESIEPLMYNKRPRFSTTFALSHAAQVVDELNDQAFWTFLIEIAFRLKSYLRNCGIGVLQLYGIWVKQDGSQYLAVETTDIQGRHFRLRRLEYVWGHARFMIRQADGTLSFKS